ESLKSQKSWYPWLVVALLWVVAFLNYLDRILITSMRDPLVADFSLTDARFGLLTSVFLWSYGILSPFGGFFADKYGRKRMIVISALVWSAVTFWTGIARSFPEMIVARTLMGISEAAYIPAGLALITDYHRSRTRSLATGIHMSGLYAGLAMGGIGGFIAEWWGWRSGFQLFGIFGILYAIFLVFLLKDAPGRKEELNIPGEKNGHISIWESARLLFGIRSYNIILIFFTVNGMVNWLVYAWLPTFLKEHFHLNLGEAGMSATGYIQAAAFAGVLAGGLLADRWASHYYKARLLVIIIGFTIGMPFLFLIPSTQLFSMAILGMLVYGVAKGFNDSNLMPVLCQVIDNRYLATGYGFLNFLSTIVGGVMVYAVGALKDANIPLSIAYQVMAVAMLLATWSLLFVKLKKENW
ncbi:MAG TPA: MFS transporter, partial [Prolixibacteraceae bacterium]|nr:MFS transporter [Prolixibacteraceae bacterium]